MPSLSLLTLAAAAELCRPFAALTSEMLVRQAWTRAYTICLNSDEPPTIPKDWLEALKLVQPGPVYKDPPGSIKAAGAKVTKAAKSATYRACKARHPRGYDPKAHTYNIYQNKKWVAVLCPKD